MPTSCCTEKEAKLSSTTFLLILIEESFGFMPCVMKTGVLRSIPGYASAHFISSIYLYVYAFHYFI